MKVVLSLIVLIGSIPISRWLADRVVQRKPDETVEHMVVRVVRWVVSIVGVGAAVVVVMVFWQTTVVRDSDRAVDLALVNGRENCESQREFEEFVETLLVADVRIATAEYRAAVAELQQIDDRLTVDIPDTSTLPPELQAFIAQAVEQSRERTLDERVAASAKVDAIDTELSRRQASLDAARAQRIDSCPPVQSSDDLPSSTTIEGD